MKVLSIVPYNIFPAKLGGQKGIALFNEYMAQQCQLECITVKSNDPSFAKGYKVYPILSNSASRYANPVYFFLIRKLIKQHKFSHLLLEHPYYGWLGMLLKWFTGVKLVIHSHNIENSRWKSLGKWWWPLLFSYEKRVHRAADYNFFIQENDRQYAISKFKLQEDKSTVITYGIDWNETASAAERQRCRRLLEKQHAIAPAAKILLFNGTLHYAPNLQAVKVILDDINPLLLNELAEYKIIICGSGLPASMNGLKDYHDRNIIYAGFVDDITVYFKAADIFINPVIEGGGIKTKLVEAIGYGTPAVSTINGSIGVTKVEAGELLKIVEDGNWTGFANEIVNTCQQTVPQLPGTFFQKFYWKNIAAKAVRFIEN